MSPAERLDRIRAEREAQGLPADLDPATVERAATLLRAPGETRAAA